MNNGNDERVKESPIQDKLALRLMHIILNVIVESGANRDEAYAALDAAKAMIPEVNLSPKPTFTVNC